MNHKESVASSTLCYAFIFTHILAWTLVPWLFRCTLPMDALEGAIWGQHLAWGYDKDPFLNGWLTALATWISGRSGFAIYLFSQLSVAGCFWAVFRLGKKILPPRHALLAVILLETLQYYNFHAIDFNDNTLELSFWALTILFFYKALTENALRNWIGTGVFAGLSMLAKYYSIMLILSMFLLLITQAPLRKFFKQPSLYIACSIFLIVLLPHLIWLYAHDFITLQYALERISNPPAWLNHLQNPLQFSWEQIEVFLPAIGFAVVFLWLDKKPFFAAPPLFVKSFDKVFLFFMGAGPFILTLFLSVVTGIKLRAAWGQPLLSLWGIIFIAWLNPYITRPRFYRFLAVFITLFMLTLFVYSMMLLRADDSSSAIFPGEKIAQVFTQEWHERYHQKLRYVAGSRWITSNLAFYSKDHPAVYIDWDPAASPWINEKKLREAGGIFFWDPADAKQKRPETITPRFASLEKLQVRHFAWLRNGELPPAEIDVAFLPPCQLKQ